VQEASANCIDDQHSSIHVPVGQVAHDLDVRAQPFHNQNLQESQEEKDHRRRLRHMHYLREKRRDPDYKRREKEREKERVRERLVRRGIDPNAKKSRLSQGLCSSYIITLLL
jgi:hypothetical protein